MKNKENMNNKILIYISLLILIIIVLSSYILENIYYKDNNNIDKDTITIVDTVNNFDTVEIIKEKPNIKYKYITKIDTFYTKDGKDTIIPTENKIYQDTLTCAKDSVIVTNYIKGQNVSLDSIKADWKKSETIITKTVEITKYIEKPRTFWDNFHIQPQATFGYDPINKNWGAVIGIGLGVDL